MQCQLGSLSKEAIAYVCCDPVVPHGHRVWLPLQARLVVATSVDVVVQQVKDSIALFLLETDDAPRELAVDVERLVARYRMTAYDGVDIYERRLFSAHVLVQDFDAHSRLAHGGRRRRAFRRARS